MRKVVFLTLVLVVVSGGAYLALGPGGGDRPSVKPPVSSDSSEPLGFCSGGEPVCNQTNCSGSNCDQICPIEDTDTGWTKCCKNGHVLDCTAIGTVHTNTCACEADPGGFCASPTAVKYFCR